MLTNPGEHFLSPKLNVNDRIESGKLLRKKFPRELHGIFNTSADRDDPVSILEEQAKTRLQDLVPVRYARMLTSPFAFFRGAAAIMAEDLAASEGNTGINVQLCGDMHIANFGIFGTAERNIVLGINDFDETIPGPFEWDLKRLFVSYVVAGRYLKADEKLIRESVKSGIRSYIKWMNDCAKKGSMELHYSSINEKSILNTFSPSMRKGVRNVINKARSRTNLQVLEKLTDIMDDKNRFLINSPFIVRETHSQSGKTIEEALGLLLDSYFLSLADDRKRLLEQYRIADVVRKVVGVGSVGTRCWLIFLTGNHNEDPLFLQVKEAQPSVLQPYVAKSAYPNQGQRVVAGQRLIQGAPDIFLGWGEQDGIHFYVRQLRDMKGGVELEPGKGRLNNLPDYCSLCARALALAHAKSGDAAVISGYIGNSDEFEKAMVRFAFKYADQNLKDYKALADAEKSGRIKAAR